MKLTKIPAFQKINAATIVTLGVLGMLCSSAFLTTACVTVNVNFPESAVQKATDDYVRELYRTKEKGKAPTAEPSKAPSTKSALDFLIPQAYAAEFAFKVDSPKALKIRDRLAKRVDEVIQHKRAGVLGESTDGLLVLKSPDKLKALFLKKVQKLVEDENADRTELYQEVLSSNSLAKNRLKDIERSFARSFQAESPAGTWVQDADGSWTQK